MSEASDALKAAAAQLLAKAVELEGGQLPSGFDPANLRTWWPAMLAQYAAASKPHEWVDWVSGVAPGDSGDNDNSVEMDDLIRVFRPFMDAATREGIEDSAGERFYLPTIKRRAGLGLQAVGVIRDEVKRLWLSQWGQDWRADQANIDAGHVPPDAEVARIFAKVYG